MKVDSYTLCFFGVLLWKEKGKKNKTVHKIWHKSVSSFTFFCASQWFQVNHFVLAVWKQLLTSPVTKSTSEVNRMCLPIEAQQHAMLFAILKPRLQDDQSCQLNSFVSCVDLHCIINLQYYILASRFICFCFWPSLSICLSVFFFFRLILADFFFFLVFHNWWVCAFFAECKNDPLSWKHCTLMFKTILQAALFFVLYCNVTTGSRIDLLPNYCLGS